MRISLDRREFLSVAAASGIVTLGSTGPEFLRRAAAAPATAERERILVVLQLSGGNDGLNTVVPHRDDEYRRRRPTLAVGSNQVLRLNDDLGLHPALRGLHELWDNGQLSVIQGVGYPRPNRSHFESMDIWHTARMGAEARGTGWLARSLESLDRNSSDAQAMHVGSEVQPLALSGASPPATSLSSLQQFRLAVGSSGSVQRQRIENDVAQARPDGSDLLQFARLTTQASLRTSQQIERVAAAEARGVAYPGTPLGGKLETVARLIDAGLSTRIYYVTLDGFDTHSAQPNAHAGLLSQWGDAVRTFFRDLGKRGHDERVLMICFSEFGRRVAENASQGTDHGAAAPMFLAGPAVRGGVVGAHPSLTDLDDGDLKHHTDFRSVYATVLKQWLRCPPAAVLGGDFPPLTLLNVPA